jgi:hypothetical protein
MDCFHYFRNEQYNSSMKKVLLLICFVLGNSLLESCGPDDTFCYELEISDVSNFSLENYDEVGAGESIAANDFAILLDGGGNGDYCLWKNTAGGSLRADIAYVPADQVTNISITSDGDLSAAYPAGTELKNLYVPVRVSRECVGNAGSDCVFNYFSEFSYSSLEEAFNGFMGQDIFLDSDSESPGSLYMFSLQTTEMITGNGHRMIVRFDFQSGQSVELETNRITLN